MASTEASLLFACSLRDCSSIERIGSRCETSRRQGNVRGLASVGWDGARLSLQIPVFEGSSRTSGRSGLCWRGGGGGSSELVSTDRVFSAVVSISPVTVLYFWLPLSTAPELLSLRALVSISPSTVRCNWPPLSIAPNLPFSGAEILISPAASRNLPLLLMISNGQPGQSL